MQNLQNLFNLRHLLQSKTILFIILAFAFGVICRYEWIVYANQISEFAFNGQIMINTNDGYYFAEGARDLLAGFHQDNDFSPVTLPLSKLIYLIASFGIFKFESILLYLSVLCSSLIVIPLILMGREIGNKGVGLIAALISVITHSYYNRTMAGYLDTDMLNIVFVAFCLWAVVRFSIKKDLISCFVISFSFLLNLWWHPSSRYVSLSLLAFFVLWAIIFDRDRRNLFFIMFGLAGLCNIPVIEKMALITLLLVIVKYEYLSAKIFVVFFIGVAGVFLATLNIPAILGSINSYFSPSSVVGSEVYFYNVSKTISELGDIDLAYFCERISNHWLVFVFSAIGYGLLCYQKRVFLVALPVIGFGFMALFFGLRWTIYAIPVMAFGFGYLLYWAVGKIQIDNKIAKPTSIVFLLLGILPLICFIYFKSTSNEQTNLIYLITIIATFCVFFGIFALKNFKNPNLILVFVITLYCLIPAFLHINFYKGPTVLLSVEAKALDELKNQSSREDYVFAWWDYGYAIKYYSDVKTLIDGGRHSGDDNFFVSYGLLKPQIYSANMARLSVEYKEKSFQNQSSEQLLSQMMKDYNYTNPNDFVSNINKIKLPPKTRDIYYFLPDRMLDILPTIARFSRLDLTNGDSFGPLKFIQSYPRVDNNGNIIVNPDMVIQKDLKFIYDRQVRYPVNTFIQITYDFAMKPKKTIYNFDSLGEFFVILQPDFGRIFVMDKEMFNSTFIQLYLLENYDHDLFEPVMSEGGMLKIYKLKK